VDKCDYLAAEGLSYVYSSDFKTPKRPTLLELPDPPNRPDPNDPDFDAKVSSYQKLFQVYAQARAYNNDAEAKH
jgi:hypothetical protein